MKLAFIGWEANGTLYTTERKYSGNEQINPIAGLKQHEGNLAKQLLNVKRLTPRYQTA